MNPAMIDEFFTEDCDSSVRQMLIETIDSCLGKNIIREYTFNRFNIRISFEDEMVVIEDELMPGEDGECKIRLSEFELKLKRLK